MVARVAEPWSQWLVASLRRPISDRDRARAAIHLLDWMGCAHLGSTSEIGAVLAKWAEKLTPGGAWACGHGGLTTAEAAFWNGSLGSCHEMDDVHREAVVHPGDVVIPAALAVAQRDHLSGPALLDAIVIGYEAAILLGLLSDKDHYAHWYSTATAGVFGGAMACAHLLGLNSRQMQSALGLAGMQASGVWQCRLEDGLAKQLAAGHSAQAGLLSADLAAAGMIGPLSILEGPLGWLKATSGNLDSVRAGELLQVTRDRPWRLHEVSFKPWSACRHVHPAIECALTLYAAGCRPNDIAQVSLETYSVAISFADQAYPKTPLEGRFSLQHAVAWALTHGSFGLEATALAGLAEPQCVGLRSRVTIQSSTDHEAAYPRRFGARLRVLTTDGQTLMSEVTNPLGDPENPLSRDQIEEKALALLTAGSWSNQAAGQLVEICRTLPGEPTLDDLWSRLATRH